MHLAQAYLHVSERLPIEDDSVKRRLDRAYQMLNGYGYSFIKLSVGGYRVYKASTSLLEDTSAIYTTDSTQCTCPDFEKARGNLCKHRLAVMLLEEMGA